MRLPAIVVNRHAVDRAYDRHPFVFSPLGRAEVSAAIHAEVADALRGGRRSELEPGKTNARTKPGQTYAWTEEGERVYVLRSDDARIFVTTTLAGVGRAWAA